MRGRQQGPYQIFAVPLLAETGFDELVDRVLVIDCPPDVQLQRLMQRDGESAAAARQIIAAQASRAERLAVADDIIVNDGSLADLEAAVEALHRALPGAGCGARGFTAERPQFAAVIAALWAAGVAVPAQVNENKGARAGD